MVTWNYYGTPTADQRIFIADDQPAKSQIIRFHLTVRSRIATRSCGRGVCFHAGQTQSRVFPAPAISLNRNVRYFGLGPARKNRSRGDDWASVRIRRIQNLQRKRSTTAYKQRGIDPIRLLMFLAFCQPLRASPNLMRLPCYNRLRLRTHFARFLHPTKKENGIARMFIKHRRVFLITATLSAVEIMQIDFGKLG